MVNKRKQSTRKLSTRLIRKGALIEETYTIMRQWDLGAPIKDNIQLMREKNPIGAQSESWLREVLTTLSSRFSTAPGFEPLVVLAQGNFPIEKWKPCLLHYIGKTDELYYRFATEWLFNEFNNGTYLMTSEDVVPFVRRITGGRLSKGDCLSEYGALRAARDLLRMAGDFGIVSGSAKKEFVSYHLYEESFLYVLHVLLEREGSTSRLIQAPDWRLFLMHPSDVERELFNLHQFRKLHYEVAGSLAQLKLTHDSPIEYAKELVA